MSMYTKIKVDWKKSPEIHWEKTLCPICSYPTGKESKCHQIEDSALQSLPEGSIASKTIEIEGSVYPIMSKQCYFRQYNCFNINTNFPISSPLTRVVSEVEGVERFTIKSPYRATLVIAEYFDDMTVKKNVNLAYLNFINSLASKKS
tara:strand:+ start:76 stop:516 length:441 start_codon:yes stop_codon:yes gene_type:complete